MCCLSLLKVNFWSEEAFQNAYFKLPPKCLFHGPARDLKSVTRMEEKRKPAPESKHCVLETSQEEAVSNSYYYCLSW